MESPDANPATSLHADLAEAHRELAKALVDVERALKRHDRSRRPIERQLGNLADLVESQFVREESGGYTDALARAPRLTTTAERLLAEHTELLDDAKKLQILARSGVESKAWWRQIESDFTTLKARLLAHEQAEKKFLHEALDGTSV